MKKSKILIQSVRPLSRYGINSVHTPRNLHDSLIYQSQGLLYSYDDSKMFINTASFFPFSQGTWIIYLHNIGRFSKWRLKPMSPIINIYKWHVLL